MLAVLIDILVNAAMHIGSLCCTRSSHSTTIGPSKVTHSTTIGASKVTHYTTISARKVTHFEQLHSIQKKKTRDGPHPVTYSHTLSQSVKTS